MPLAEAKSPRATGGLTGGGREEDGWTSGEERRGWDGVVMLLGRLLTRGRESAVLATAVGEGQLKLR